MAANLQHRTRLTFAWVAIVPLLLGVVLFWASGRYQAITAGVSHTQDVLVASETLLLLITDEESNQRGFLLARDPDFLDRFNNGKPRIRRQVTTLRNLTIDNLAQQSNIARLQIAVDQRMKTLDTVLSRSQFVRGNAGELTKLA